MQQQVYGGNNSNYNPTMRPRGPGTPVTIQQQLSVDSSGGSVAPSPLPSPAPQPQQQPPAPANQTGDSSDPSASGGGGGGGGIGSINVAPCWLEFDSFGFPKIGLKGGGTDGPLSPHPLVVAVPEAEKTQQAPAVNMNCTGTPAEGVEIPPLNEVEQPIVSDTPMDPSSSTAVANEANGAASATDQLIKSEQQAPGEMRPLGHLAESGTGGACVQDPIKSEERTDSSTSSKLSGSSTGSNVEGSADPLMNAVQVVTLTPPLAPRRDETAELIRATVPSSPSAASDNVGAESSVEAGPSAASVADPLLPCSVDVNESKAAVEDVNRNAHAPEVKQESSKATPVETAVVVVVPPPISTPIATPSPAVVATVSVPVAVTLASKVSLKTLIPKSSSSTGATTVTTVTLSAVPITNPSASGVTQSHPVAPTMSMASVPMTSVRTVSVPTSILVRAPVANRLSSPLNVGQRPLPTLTLNPTSAPHHNAPVPVHQQKVAPQAQQQTQVVVKQEKGDEEQVAARSPCESAPAEESNPLLVQQQQQVNAFCVCFGMMFNCLLPQMFHSLHSFVIFVAYIERLIEAVAARICGCGGCSRGGRNFVRHDVVICVVQRIFDD